MILFQPNRLTICVLILAIGVGLFVRGNPLLFGRSAGSDSSLALLANDNKFRAVRENKVIEYVLEKYRAEIGDDYEPYRNHCLRVLLFALYHLEKQQNGSFSDEDADLMAWALAYHDIGLWTSKKLNYLEPSVAVMERDAQVVLQERVGGQKEQNSVFPVLDETNLATAREIILQHHKYTEWKGSGSVTVRIDLVNAVRKGDWADATMGVVRYGLPATYLQAAYKEIPTLGFHAVLEAFPKRLSPDSWIGRLELLEILKW